jgi:hypothetical protein
MLTNGWNNGGLAMRTTIIVAATIIVSEASALRRLS